jgi:hypothetical protein
MADTAPGDLLQIYDDPELGSGRRHSSQAVHRGGLGGPPKGVMHLTEEQIESYRKNVDMDHVQTLTQADLAKPLIGLRDSVTGKLFVVDGHHRSVRLWDDGARETRMHVLPIEFFGAFVFENRAECKTAAQALYDLRQEQGG